MFTGIVKEQGTVAAVGTDGDRLKLTIEASFDDLVLGESIALNGACLTVMELGPGNFSVEAIVTTRDRTTLGELGAGARVNLERALAVGERLGGHFVQGHVDGVAEILSVTPRDDAVLIDVKLPSEIAAVIDRGHTALTEFALNGVAAFEGCVEAGDGIGHGRTPSSDRGQHPRVGR